MRGHILNCASIELYFPRINVATCTLLIEWGDGLLLVDTGIGEQDHLHPSWGMKFMGAFVRTFGKAEETAIKQITKLGYSPNDIKHIVMTHLHIDHAGGLRDFPDAQVHIVKTELENATQKSILRGTAYLAEQWSHNPNWVIHEKTDVRDWFGFEAFPILTENSMEVLLVPLPGHSRGHCGVAISDGKRWVFHCGDAVALDAIKTPPNTLAAKPLGLHYAKLHALAQNEDLQFIQSHYLTGKVPVFKN